MNMCGKEYKCFKLGFVWNFCEGQSVFGLGFLKILMLKAWIFSNCFVNEWLSVFLMCNSERTIKPFSTINKLSTPFKPLKKISQTNKQSNIRLKVCPVMILNYTAFRETFNVWHRNGERKHKTTKKRKTNKTQMKRGYDHCCWLLTLEAFISSETQASPHIKRILKKTQLYSFMHSLRHYSIFFTWHFVFRLSYQVSSQHWRCW